MKMLTPPPSQRSEQLAKGSIVSRRDVLKGALVGAGALAAMSLPTPLMELVPDAGPKKALAATQNVADGIYAFRYHAQRERSLDVPRGVNSAVDVLSAESNNSHAQYWVVTYDSSFGAYKIMPICGQDGNFVLTADNSYEATLKVRVDQKASNQRWLFTKNSNGSWAIKIKSNTSLCVNLQLDNRADGARTQIFTYSSSDTASQWDMDCLITAIKDTVETADITKVYEPTFELKNVRDNEPQLLSTLPSGWKATYTSGKNLDTIYYSTVYRSTTPQSFKIVYPDCADVAGQAVDIQVDITVIGGDMNIRGWDIYQKTWIDFNWEAKARSGLLGGICVLRSPGFDCKYTVVNRSTGKTVSLKGALMTVGSLNGICRPSEAYTTSITTDLLDEGCTWEGVSYRAGSTPVKSYRVADHHLMRPCSGYTIGVYEEDIKDFPGGANYEKVAVCYQIADDTPTLSLRNMALTGGHANSQWFFPMFCGFGIMNPGAPNKSAKITS